MARTRSITLVCSREKAETFIASLMWLTSCATVPFICVIACSIGVQTVQFNNWEYRPLNCDAVAAAVATADCDGEGCRSTEASAWSADRQIRRLGNSSCRNANFYSRYACSLFAPLALLFVWRHDGMVCLGEEGVWCFSACISKGENEDSRCCSACCQGKGQGEAM